MKRIKIAQIGMAHDHATGKMECVRKFPDVFEIVGIAEENEENMRKYVNLECYRGINVMTIDELLMTPELNAVMIETEEMSLITTAQKCIDKGIHVHIDKPAGNSIEAFKNLLTTAKKNNLIVQMAYMYRYNPAAKYCLDAVKNGRLGEIFRVQAIMNTYHHPEKREWMKAFPGGIMFYLGCHMIDLVLLMMGAPEKITPFCKSTGLDGVNVTDIGFAVFEYESGIATVEALSADVNGYGRRSLLVCGSKGSIEIRPLEGEYNSNPTLMLSLKETNQGREYTDCKCVVPMPAITGRYDDMMLDFAQMVRDDKVNPYNYEYELLLQKTVLTSCGKGIGINQ